MVETDTLLGAFRAELYQGLTVTADKAGVPRNGTVKMARF